MKGCCENRKPLVAEEVLRRWNLVKYDLERHSERQALMSKPVAASYGIIINFYVKSGQMAEARRMLARMQWDSVPPSFMIFNMLIEGYLAGNNLGAAQGVFRELEGSGTWDMESLEIKPDAASYTSFMNYWAAQGDVDAVERLLERMLQKGVEPDEQVYGVLVKAYSRARNPSRAEEVLVRMTEKGINAGVVVYSTVISGFCALGDMGSARRVLETMESSKVRPNERTFGHILWGYGQIGDMSGIVEVTRHMSETGIKLDNNMKRSINLACQECGLDARSADNLLRQLVPTRHKKSTRWKRSKQGKFLGKLQGPMNHDDEMKSTSMSGITKCRKLSFQERITFATNFASFVTSSFHRKIQLFECHNTGRVHSPKKCSEVAPEKSQTLTNVIGTCGCGMASVTAQFISPVNKYGRHKRLMREISGARTSIRYHAPRVLGGRNKGSLISNKQCGVYM